jgi:predicted RNA-binding Zn-ribbon protein involved in translation (DUF1610 family)
VRITEIEPSGLVVLECGKCGEKVILLGRKEDWHSEGRTAFECGDCGATLVLAEHVGEANLGVRG